MGLYLGPPLTTLFTWAESNANEQNPLFSLICIRFMWSTASELGLRGEKNFKPRPKNIGSLKGSFQNSQRASSSLLFGSPPPPGLLPIVVHKKSVHYPDFNNVNNNIYSLLGVV